MKKLHISLYFLFFLFLWETGNCQNNFKPGYIISLSSDTIYGLINFTSNTLNYTECEFKKDLESKTENYGPADIQAYCIQNSKYYISKEVEIDGKTAKTFLEYLVNGVVDLYYYNKLTSEYFFIEKDGVISQLNNDKVESTDEYGTKYIRQTKQYLGVLYYQFKDVPELRNKIAATDFNYRSLIDISVDYHKKVCKDYDCIDYTKSTKRIIFFEPTLGIISSRMGLSTSKDFAKDIKPVFGMNVKLSSVRSNDKFAFEFGLNYSTNSFSTEYENLLYDNRIKYYFIDIKYSMLHIPLTIEYSFLSHKLRPSLFLTYNNVFLLNPQYAIEKRNYILEDEYIAVEVDSKFRSYQIGFSSGIGLRYNINEDSYLKSNIGAEYRFPSSNLNYILDYHNVQAVFFTLGYGFRINK
jgi:hypothetical protein